MQTLTIDIINEKAINLIRDMEILKLIRIRKDDIQQGDSIDWASKYKGAMKKQSITEVEKELNDLRNSWE